MFDFSIVFLNGQFILYKPNLILGLTKASIGKEILRSSASFIFVEN